MEVADAKVLVFGVPTLLKGIEVYWRKGDLCTNGVALQTLASAGGSLESFY